MGRSVLKTVPHERAALSVSELTRLIKELMESQPSLTGIWVRGETSNVSLSPTGHLFFKLKDEAAELQCVFFSYGYAHKRELPQGVSILAFGDVSVYEKKGAYQLVVRDFIVRGEGELAQRFELLKRKLAAEGLFDEKHKLPLPEFPHTVGIVTSGEAAALRDVVTVLSRRAPYLRGVVFGALVQGEKAAPSIIAALGRAESSGLVEVILLVRGGGSLEDLWCFNDEELARAIYKLKVPVITGVGHEVDFTIADFVADRRAPTPSAAAELVAPDIAGLRRQLGDAAEELAGSALSRLRLALAGFRTVKVSRLLSDTVGRLTERERVLRDHARAAVRSCRQRLAYADRGLAEGEMRLSPRRVLGRVLDSMERLDGAAARLTAGVGRAVGARDHQVALAYARLSAVDPQAALNRGYALLWDETRSRLLRSIVEAPADSRVIAELTDGYLHARVSEAEAKVKSPDRELKRSD